MSQPVALYPPVQDRQLSLDLLRCLAIAGVVVMHCAAPLLFSADPVEVWAGLTYSSLSLFCVPSLLMISGALMLGGSKPLDLRRFYGKRFVKIVVPLVAWSAIYYVLLCIQVGDWPHLASFVKRFFTGMWSGPLWFLYMITGVYLMLPFLRPAFSDASSARGPAFVGIVFGVSALGFVTRLVWEQDVNRFFSGAIIPYYFGYFVLGHLLHSREVRVPGGKATLAATFLACAGASAWGEWLAKGADTMLPNTFYNYQQPLVALMSASIFLLFKGWRPGATQRRGRVVHEVSCLSYGIFLSHVLVLMLVTGQIPWLVSPGGGLDWRTIHPWVGPLLTGLTVFTVSALLTAGLKRVPFLERIVP